MNDLEKYLDLANHHANATPNDIENLCTKVLEFGFHAAFVNPCSIAHAKKILGGHAPVGTAISFPLGQDQIPVKIEAVRQAIHAGADELDIVPNIALLIETPDGTRLFEELQAIVSAVREVKPDTIVKFILETAFLSPAHIQTGAQTIERSGADYVKLCTGMGPRGASIEDVRLVRQVITAKMHVKAAGGIDTRDMAEALLKAGVNRIGTSKAVEIIQDTPPKKSSRTPTE